MIHPKKNSSQLELEDKAIAAKEDEKKEIVEEK